MNSKVVIQREHRDLTQLERGYARSKLRLAHFWTWCGLSFGVFLLWAGVALPLAEIEQGRGIGAGSSVLALLLVGVAGILGGCLAIPLYARRRHALDARASKLAGALLVDRFRSSHPTHGETATHLRCWIGDVRLVWPRGSEPLYRELVGRRIEVVGVMLKRSHAGNWLQGLARLDQEPETLVVLEFNGVIRIHHALAKYGRHYFLRRAIYTGLACLLGLVTMAAAVMYLTEHVDHRHLSAVGVVVGTVLACFVLLALAVAMDALYLYVARVCKLDIGKPSHIDKLRG